MSIEAEKCAFHRLLADPSELAAAVVRMREISRSIIGIEAEEVSDDDFADLLRAADPVLKFQYER